MKQIVIFTLALTMLFVSISAERRPPSKISRKLTKIAESLGPDASVKQKGGTVTLSYRTRTFMVHNTDRLGRRSEKTHKAVGPRYDGLIVKVTEKDGRYAGAAKTPHCSQKPYWTTYLNAYPMNKGTQHLHVIISYGSRTDREVIRRLKKFLASVSDPTPKAKDPAQNKTNTDRK